MLTGVDHERPPPGGRCRSPLMDRPDISRGVWRFIKPPGSVPGHSKKSGSQGPLFISLFRWIRKQETPPPRAILTDATRRVGSRSPSPAKLGRHEKRTLFIHTSPALLGRGTAGRRGRSHILNGRGWWGFLLPTNKKSGSCDPLFPFFSKAEGWIRNPCRPCRPCRRPAWPGPRPSWGFRPRRLPS